MGDLTQRLMKIFDGLVYQGRHIECRPCTHPQIIRPDEEEGASRKAQSDRAATTSAIPSVQENTQGSTGDAIITTEAVDARIEQQAKADDAMTTEVVHCKSDVRIEEQAKVDDARTTEVADSKSRSMVEEQAKADDV